MAYRTVQEWSNSSNDQPTLVTYQDRPVKKWGNISVSTNHLDAHSGTVQAPTYWEVQQKAKKIQGLTIILFTLLAVASAGGGIYCAFHFPKMALILIAPFSLSILGCFGPTIFFKIMKDEKKKYLKQLREGSDPYNPSELGYLNEWISTSDLNKIIEKDFLQISSTQLEKKYGKAVAAIYQKLCGLIPIKQQCNQFLQKFKNLIKEIEQSEYKELYKGLTSLEKYFDDADETNYIAKINLFVLELSKLPHAHLLQQAPLDYYVNEFHKFLRAYGTHTEGAGFVTVSINDGHKKELIPIPLLSALQSSVFTQAAECDVSGKNSMDIRINNEHERTFWRLWSELAYDEVSEQANFEIDEILVVLHMATEIYKVGVVKDYCLEMIKKMLLDAKETGEKVYLDLLKKVYVHALEFDHKELKEICVSKIRYHSRVLLQNLKTKMLELMVNKNHPNYSELSQLHHELYLRTQNDANYLLEPNRNEFVHLLNNMNASNYIDSTNLLLQKLAALPHAALLRDPPFDSIMNNMYNFLNVFVIDTKSTSPGFCCFALNNTEVIKMPLFAVLESSTVSKWYLDNISGDKRQLIPIFIQNDDERAFWHFWSARLSLNLDKINDSLNGGNILSILKYAHSYKVKNIKEICLKCIGAELLQAKGKPNKEEYNELLANGYKQAKVMDDDWLKSMLDTLSIA